MAPLPPLSSPVLPAKCPGNSRATPRPLLRRLPGTYESRRGWLGPRRLSGLAFHPGRLGAGVTDSSRRGNGTHTRRAPRGNRAHTLTCVRGEAVSCDGVLTCLSSGLGLRVAWVWKCVVSLPFRSNVLAFCRTPGERWSPEFRSAVDSQVVRQEGATGHHPARAACGRRGGGDSGTGGGVLRVGSASELAAGLAPRVRWVWNSFPAPSPSDRWDVGWGQGAGWGSRLPGRLG